MHSLCLKVKSTAQGKMQQSQGSSTRGFDPDGLKLPPWIPAFTRRREVFTGRIAMLGFLAACANEVPTVGVVTLS
jgi:Chlorophyll A-B binding protein